MAEHSFTSQKSSPFYKHSHMGASTKVALFASDFRKRFQKHLNHILQISLWTIAHFFQRWPCYAGAQVKVKVLKHANNNSDLHMEDTRHTTCSSTVSSSTHAWEFSEMFLIVLHWNLQEEEISSISVPLYIKTFYIIKSHFITKFQH